MENIVPEPLKGAFGSMLEQFHGACDPSAILDDTARHAFYDNDGIGEGNDADAAKGRGKRSGRNSSGNKQRGPPSPDGSSTDQRRRTAKGGAGGGDDDKDAQLDAVAKSRARIAANRIKNRRVSIGKTRSAILTRPHSPASASAHRSFGYNGYGGSFTDYSTSMDSADVYLTEADDDDFEEGDEEEETMPTTTAVNAKKGSKSGVGGPESFGGSSNGGSGVSSKQLLAKAASLVGCGSSVAHGGNDDDDDDDDKDEREERRGGGGGGGGFRGLAVDPCGAGVRCGSGGGSSDRDMAPSPSPRPPPKTIIDLSAYESLEAPYDHLLERVAVMTLQMEKMRDEFDKMRTENAILLDNLTLAGDAAAHLGLGGSEDEDDRRMDGNEYDDEDGGYHPAAVRTY